MKKVVMILLFFGLLTWTLFEFVSSSDNSEPDEEIAADDNGVENTDSEENNTNENVVGLDIGNIAPDFKLTTLDGSEASLSDYHGTKIMVNFWATWCPPCKAEMPDMETLYHNEDVEILAINVTTTEEHVEDVHEFVDEFELTFPILLDEERKVTEDYQVLPLPTSYMIDTEGIIQYKAYGLMSYEQMEQVLDFMN